MLALALLVHRQAHPAPDLLALFYVRDGLVQRADLEDIGVVPALPQGRMGEDESHRLVEGQQALLGVHDQLVGFAILLGLARGAVLQDDLPAARAALGEIARLDISRRAIFPGREGSFQIVIRLGEQTPDNPLFTGIIVHPVDEE